MQILTHTHKHTHKHTLWLSDTSNLLRNDRAFRFVLWRILFGSWWEAIQNTHILLAEDVWFHSNPVLQIPDSERVRITLATTTMFFPVQYYFCYFHVKCAYSIMYVMYVCTLSYTLSVIQQVTLFVKLMFPFWRYKSAVPINEKNATSEIPRKCPTTDIFVTDKKRLSYIHSVGGHRGHYLCFVSSKYLVCLLEHFLKVRVQLSVGCLRCNSQCLFIFLQGWPTLCNHLLCNRPFPLNRSGTRSQMRWYCGVAIVNRTVCLRWFFLL